MFCFQCNRSLIYCNCPDIEERLKRLLAQPSTNLVAAQILLDRKVIREHTNPMNN